MDENLKKRFGLAFARALGIRADLGCGGPHTGGGPWLLAFVFIFAIPAYAIQTSQDLVLRTTVEQIEWVADEEGEARAVLTPADRFTVVDVVIYTVAFTNSGRATLAGAVIDYRVPENMQYLEGSAVGPGTEITFSADGGRTFDLPEALYIVDRDGHRRQARADDYTHIRWVMRHGLPAGATGFVRFHAQME